MYKAIASFYCTLNTWTITSEIYLLLILRNQAKNNMRGVWVAHNLDILVVQQNWWHIRTRLLCGLISWEAKIKKKSIKESPLSNQQEQSEWERDCPWASRVTPKKKWIGESTRYEGREATGGSHSKRAWFSSIFCEGERRSFTVVIVDCSEFGTQTRVFCGEMFF